MLEMEKIIFLVKNDKKSHHSCVKSEHFLFNEGHQSKRYHPNQFWWPQ